MIQLQISESADVNASADRVYALLADYRHGHPRILPPENFLGIELEAGGTGAGTRFRLRSRLLGVERTLRMTVAEPEPGRVLTEADAASDLLTTFTVDPLPGGKRARVSLHTRWTPQRGVPGLIERFVVRGVLRKVYVRELALLADVFNPEHGSPTSIRQGVRGSD